MEHDLEEKDITHNNNNQFNKHFQSFSKNWKVGGVRHQLYLCSKKKLLDWIFVLEVCNMDSSIGKMCLEKDVIEISNDRNEGLGDWDHLNTKIQQEVEKKKKLKLWCDNHDLSIFDNQSIERDRLIGIGFVLDFVEFISFTFSDKEIILVIEAVSR
ncbi:hypothetical protein Tco_0008972 [Tanacetum coccineum]